MFEWLHGWAGLILGFSGLIFIHELGHFALAKWNGVRVHVFSVGMGPYLISFTWGETVYALSLIPIGGYVKLMGQDDMNVTLAENKDPHDYRNKRPGQKAAILAAGAGFNLAFTIFAFTMCYYIGIDVKPPRIGAVIPGTPLAAATVQSNGEPANLKEGDRIVEVNGVPVKTYLEAMLQISGSPNNQDLQLKIMRPPFRSEDIEYISVKTRKDEKLGASSIGMSPLSEKRSLNAGFGTEQAVVVNADLATVEGGKLKDKPAAKAGLKLGDQILQIDGVVIREPKDLSTAVRESAGKPLKLRIRSDGNERDVEVAAVQDKETKVWQLGLPMFGVARVERIDPNSVAYKNGMRVGSLIVDLDLKANATTTRIAWKNKLSDKTEISAVLPLQPEDSAYKFTYDYPVTETLKVGPGEALTLAWGDTVRFSSNVFTIIRGLFTRDVDTSALSGAVGIGSVMYKVASNESFLNFLWFLGFISLNLGVLQFVPIPLLDGWHLLMVTIEKLKGTPVSMKVQEAFQYVGIVMVGGLLLLATYNDLTRMLFAP